MNKREIKREIELAMMMVSDMDKVYKKYAKAALAAQEARLERIRSEKYFDCTTVEELRELYGYGNLTNEEYDAGRDFFAEQEIRQKQYSLIERHRANVKEIRDRWKGTINELRAELEEQEKSLH